EATLKVAQSAAAVLLTLDPARLAHCAEQAANALAVLDGGGVRMVIARLEPRHTFAGPPDELQRRTAAFASLLAHPLVVAQMARTAAPGVSPVKVPSWVHTAVPAFAVAGSGC
ncbi:MAG: hypothetical protein CFE45_01555, partial [Burkholderiales bacterium PBB5]